MQISILQGSCLRKLDRKKPFVLGVRCRQKHRLQITVSLPKILPVWLQLVSGAYNTKDHAKTVPISYSLAVTNNL